MSLLAPLQSFIHRIDTEAAADLADLKASMETRLRKALPVIEKLENDIKTAVTDAAEQAAPGLRAAVDVALTAAENDLRTILGL